MIDFNDTAFLGALQPAPIPPECSGFILNRDQYHRLLRAVPQSTLVAVMGGFEIRSSEFMPRGFGAMVDRRGSVIHVFQFAPHSSTTEG